MKLGSVLALVSASVMCLAQSNIQEFKAANQLQAKRKYAEAAEVYRQLAGKEKGYRQNYAGLMLATMLTRAKKTQEAMDAAEQISDPTYKAYARLIVLFESRNSREIVKQFADLKADQFPEEYQHRALYMYGNACGLLKQYDKAMPALEEAVKNAGSDTEGKMLALMDYTTYAQMAGELDKALAAADQAIQYKTFITSYMYLRPLLIKAEILIQRKKYAEAEETLKQVSKQTAQGTGPWTWRYYMLSGDLALAQNSRDQARECYQKALTAAGKAKHLIVPAEKKLAALK